MYAPLLIKFIFLFMKQKNFFFKIEVDFCSAHLPI